MRPWHSFFYLIAVVCSTAFGANPPAAARGVSTGQYSHRIWRIEDGLPQNRIRAITQTPDGYLWVGTSEGLARFDGARFSVFDRSNTPALEDDGILVLRLARDGVLWIGTEGGGLVSYKGGKFRTFGVREGLTNGFVRSIYEDKSTSLWIGTDRGFFRLNGTRFERLDGTPEIPLATVNSVAQDEEGRLWVHSAASGLVTITDGKLVPSPADCGALSFRSVTDSRDGGPWGIFATGAGRLRNGCPVRDRSLPDIPMRSITQDSQGAVWVGTAGMGLIRSEHGHVTRFTDPSVLPDSTINTVFEDREQNLWIGTEDGLLRMSRSFVASIGAVEGLEDDNVLTTYAGRQYVWMATLTGQVYRATATAVSRFPLPAPASDLHVRTVMEDDTGALWFGTFGDGLIRLADGKAVAYSKKDGLRSNTVRQLLQDRSGAIWIALESGLSRWDGHGFRNYYLEDGLSYPSTRCMVVDAKGDILIGTDSGLNRVHDGKIVPDPEFAALAKEKIWAIYQDPTGTLWLGTRGGGLLRLRSGKVSRFTTMNGLPSNTIYQILVDTNGKFWMNSSSGIFSADASEFERLADGRTELINVTSYGIADGMRTSQMNGGFQPAGARAASGELWFPSVKGAARINPATMIKRRTPPMLIEKLIADGISIPLSGEAGIPPGRRHFEIDFTLCDLVAPQRASFRYKLEGFDENWNPASQRSVSYANLRPGHYRFRVRAQDSSSRPDVSEAVLSFTLEPLFYQTDWFYGLSLLACATLIWGGMRFYARQTRARYSLVLNERMEERGRVAREMHDTIIQGCVGVSTLLEAVDRFSRVNAAEAGKLLDDARSQIKVTLEEARQAIWDLRYASAEQASVTMLFDLARKLGVAHRLEVETELSGNGELDPETDRTLLLVGREALRNAVAHGHPSRVEIRLTLGDSEAILEVRDDGIGFTAIEGSNASNKHFGMIGMRERVEKSGGSILIESTLGKGTRIVARVPLSGHSESRAAARIPFVKAR